MSRSPHPPVPPYRRYLFPAGFASGFGGGSGAALDSTVERRGYKGNAVNNNTRIQSRDTISESCHAGEPSALSRTEWDVDASLIALSTHSRNMIQH